MNVVKHINTYIHYRGRPIFLHDVIPDIFPTKDWDFLKKIPEGLLIENQGVCPLKKMKEKTTSYAYERPEVIEKVDVYD